MILNVFVCSTFVVYNLNWESGFIALIDTANIIFHIHDYIHKFIIISLVKMKQFIECCGYNGFFWSQYENKIMPN